MLKIKKSISILLVLSMVFAISGCANDENNSPKEAASKPTTENGNGLVTNTHTPNTATEITKAVNAGWYDKLNFEDEKEFENATKGLIEAPESVVIYNDAGEVVWSVDALGNLEGEAPDTVNPSLWRNTQLNAYAGLFEVCDGIYQVRGYDMANATFIRTDNGWIVFDVLMCKEDMQAAYELMKKHFGEMDIKAILYSHSHVDHFGGVEGIISKEDVVDATLSIDEQLKSDKVVVIAPEGFLEHAVSENIYAGMAMSRRAQYQYGTLVGKGSTGSLAMGIGIGQAVGTVSLIAPTIEITSDIESLTIDGLEIEFMLTPGTEAPAEMNAYFPKYEALWMAENCTGTLHNLYTLRGAQIRDGNAWAKYILEADAKYSDKAKVVFQSHNWPHWEEEIHDYLVNTASVYKFIHDQTLHYINQGYTSTEIANMLELPEALEKVWYTRQYYGTLSHNVKAMYQKYMGWYDANPVNLNLLTPEETAKKWVEYLGDVDKVLEMARKDFQDGQYQWVAQITKELVYADPENEEARNLCADALEQLGYQAESGTWRNAYLVGAMELREGNQSANAVSSSGLNNMFTEMTMDMLLDYVAIITDSKKAENEDISLNLVVTDTKESYYITRQNGVLLYYEGVNKEGTDATITGPRKGIIAAIMAQNTEFIKIEGDNEILEKLMKYTDRGDKNFNIIEP